MMSMADGDEKRGWRRNEWRFFKRNISFEIHTIDLGMEEIKIKKKNLKTRNLIY